ncbi:hypothetical protein IB211_00296c [Intestinimonas butyriciproducens]|uniref:Uncharacterized protein n=1 Tax=Intestinimonas butyriciproducens TaxID=1297617 RepID=A0A0S2W043_9FIRM|nr:hypothetical protein IB211_00296c [Intestinimonas butyriciproducens]
MIYHKFQPPPCQSSFFDLTTAGQLRPGRASQPVKRERRRDGPSAALFS